jgi:hypothetical protein
MAEKDGVNLDALFRRRQGDVRVPLDYVEFFDDGKLADAVTLNHQLNTRGWIEVEDPLEEGRLKQFPIPRDKGLERIVIRRSEHTTGDQSVFFREVYIVHDPRRVEIHEVGLKHKDAEAARIAAELYVGYLEKGYRKIAENEVARTAILAKRRDFVCSRHHG